MPFPWVQLIVQSTTLVLELSWMIPSPWGNIQNTHHTKLSHSQLSIFQSARQAISMLHQCSWEEHVAKWIGHWTQHQKVWGFNSQCWPCIKVSGKLCIPCFLSPASCNGYLVHRSKVGSRVAGCCAPTVRGGKVWRTCSHMDIWTLNRYLYFYLYKQHGIKFGWHSMRSGIWTPDKWMMHWHLNHSAMYLSKVFVIS